MKAMQKTSRGTGFRGVLNYALEEGKGIVIGGNMSGKDAASLASEFGISRRQRPDIEKPVWHQALRLPKGEKLSNEQWCQIGDAYMKKMGFSDNHQRLYILEDDPDGQHIHIPASRIALDGTLYYGQNENLISTRATQELEKEFGLILTKGPEYDPDGKIVMPAVSRPKASEVNKAIKEGKQPIRMQIQHVVAEILKEKPTTMEFIRKLELAGITAVPNIASTGTMNGFSFEADGIRFTGSQLGDDYKWQHLQQRIDYDQTRDSTQLAQHKQLIADRNREAEPVAIESGLAEPGPSIDGSGSHPDSTRDAEADRIVDLPEIDRPAEPSAGCGGSDRVANVAAGREPDGAIGGVQSVPGDDDRKSGDIDQADRVVPDKSGQANSGSRDIGESGSRLSADSVRDSDQIEQAVQPESHRALPSVQHSVELICDLSAPVQTTNTEHPGPASGGEAHRASPDDTATKLAAWKRQAAALDAPEYRVTLVGRRDGQPKGINLGKQKDDSPERFWTAADVAAKIPELRRYNARGFDVYVTPISDAHHYLVMDDARSATAQKIMREDVAYAPCLVQKSSDDNYQVVMKVPKDTRPDEQTIANSFITELNTQDGDANFHGAVHAFRMAGFSNKKEIRNNEFTTILVAANRLSPYAASALTDGRARADTIRENLAKAQREAETEVERKKRISDVVGYKPPGQVARGAAKYDDVYRKAACDAEKVFTGRVDWSVIDYRAGLAIVKRGGDIDDVKAAIQRNSPQLSDRHTDQTGYIERTATALQADPKYQVVLQEREQAQRRDGPERGFSR